MTPAPANRIPSHPTYAPLQPRPGHAALMIADAGGAVALAQLLAQAPDLRATARILLVAADVPPDLPAVTPVPGTEALEAAIAGALQGARMGLQAYLAGSQGLIGQAQALLLAQGMAPGAIQMQQCGGPARRMQCVHCKTIAPDVVIDPYRCPGCGRWLYVRDHFSRRLGAFQGVCIDAETPGLVPEPTEIAP
ncbi:hypothetical protein FA743_11210 [Paracoccus gahaiensis]|uniref:Uncharacterized protein n=1 Tax=Paracoccus gahaiensis TaxID=1706839 RepID=A0A4U0RA68_9RHOB|nr:dimethylamine monooxygenase subunit DmmA family protein [Paracoccus gahaiensis]TJZ91360.1 hypothetical protein FA743_11210 [Paracoccus gahaiensis]